MNDTHTLNFDLLVREHQAGLRAFIRALGADEAWVDDLAQEVFIIAYKKQSQFRPEEDFGKWIRGIARRQVMGERTKTARRYRILHDGISDILLSLGNEQHEPEPDHVKAVETMKSWRTISGKNCYSGKRGRRKPLRNARQQLFWPGSTPACGPKRMPAILNFRSPNS